MVIRRYPGQMTGVAGFLLWKLLLVIFVLVFVDVAGIEDVLDGFAVAAFDDFVLDHGEEFVPAHVGVAFGAVFVEMSDDASEVVGFLVHEDFEIPAEKDFAK